jgi:hypothetical protein
MLRTHPQDREPRVSRAGTRFQRLHALYADHELKWLKEVMLFAALACFTIGIAFVFAAGPAWFFLGLAFLIVATQSRAVARFCDEAELHAHQLARRFQLWRESRRSAPPLVTEPPPHELHQRKVEREVEPHNPVVAVPVAVSPPHPIQRPVMRTEPYGVVCDVEARPVRVVTTPAPSAETRPSAV